jgi:predicted RNA binding protein YcfA (HicA-like mRNA interferase family)
LKHVSGKQMCKILEAHGWVWVRTGKHRVYQKPGELAQISVPYHGNKPLKTGTQKGIMKSAGLTEADL